MRKLLVAVPLLLLASSPGNADPFVELFGGLVSPVSNDNWTNAVDPSAKLGARLGSGAQHGLGGMASVDWSPMAADSTILHFQRFRILGHIQLRNEAAKNVTISARFGAGLDLLHESAKVVLPLLGTVEGSDTDLGIAFEVAAGIWFKVGTVQLGGELGVPISYHSNQGNTANPSDPNDAKFDYTSVDIDVLFGVRLAL